MPLDYFVWAIVGRNRTIVLDTGFDAAEAKKRGREHLRTPTEALRHVGVTAESAEEVILSHMHYDHCGNLEQFPKARIYLQDACRTEHIISARTMDSDGNLATDEIRVAIRVVC